VITSTESQNRSFSAHASVSVFLLGSLSGQYSDSSSSFVDYTKLIAADPEAKIKNRTRVDRDQARLKSALKSWVDDNIFEIALLKRTAIDFVVIANELIRQGEKINLTETIEVLNMAMNVSFLGEHHITKCVAVNFSNRLRSKESMSEGSASGSILFGLVRASGGFKSEQREYWRQISHTDAACTASHETFKVDQRDSIYKINFSYMDQLLVDWYRHARMNVELNQKAPLYPTFGSPYFR
jgi:hypothetical protein